MLPPRRSLALSSTIASRTCVLNVGPRTAP